MIRHWIIVSVLITATIAASSCRDARDKPATCSSMWTTHQVVSGSSVDAQHPCMAVDSNDVVHIVWEEVVGPGGSETVQVYYGNSSDWNNTQTVVSSALKGAYSPAVGIDSNDVVHVVWQDWQMAYDQIHYANSTDWAGTWTDISNTPDYSHDPAIAVDSNDVLHVAWSEYYGTSHYEVIYANSTDWAATQVNISNTYWDSNWPVSIAVDSNDIVHIAWCEQTDDGSLDIFYANSGNWSSTQTNISSSFVSREPSLAIDSCDTVHVVWEETVNDDTDVYYANSVSWGGTKQDVSNTTSIFLWRSFYPQIAIDSSDVLHVVWEEFRDSNHSHVYYCNSGR